MRTPKRMRKQSLAPMLALLLLNFSIGCSSLRPFPTSEFYEFDPKNQVCGQYTVNDGPDGLQFAWVKDIPVVQCVAIFGFKSSDTPKVIDWITDAKNFAKSCK